MAETGAYSRHEFCFACLDFGDDKIVRSYYLSNQVIAYALEESEISLCNMCKSKAKQAETFFGNLLKNQKLWKENIYVLQQQLISQKQELSSSSSLSCTEPVAMDFTKEIKLSNTKNQSIQTMILHQPSSSNEEVMTLPLPMQIKMERLMESNDNSSQFDNDDHKDEEQIDYEDIESGFNLKRHMEAFKTAMQKFKCKPKVSDEVKTVPDRVFKPRPGRRKKGKDNIETIQITREQCMEERMRMSADPKYIEALYKCEGCIKGFVHKSAYDNHMEKHSEMNGSYECDICYQRVDCEDKMIMHKKYHFVRYKCGYCGITRICKSTIQDHNIAVHTKIPQQLTCPHCPKTFKRMVSRKKHIMYHHRERCRVSCRFCPKTYSNQEGLNNHCLNAHPLEISEEPPRRPYVCEDCGKAFMAPSQLKKHQVKHTDKKEFYCVECDKSFKSESILKHHLRVATPHVNYMELPFPCIHCDKRFSVRRDLEFHMNGIHLKIKPYQCDKCDRAYPSKCSLSKHIQVVHNGRPKNKHPCPMCDKEFDNLKNHMRTHTGERPFECPECPMKFSQTSILNTHIRLIHLKLTRKGLRKPEK